MDWHHCDMEKTFIFAGGGTGGHLYPALAMARNLKTQYPDLKIIFMGAERGLESKIVGEQSEFDLILFPSLPMHRSVGLWKRLKMAVRLPFLIMSAYFKIRKLKPVYMLGVGGYAAFVPMIGAKLAGVSSGVWEPNAYPGMANTYLSYLTQDAYVVFEKAMSRLKSKNKYQVGLSIRKEIEEAAKGKTLKLYEPKKLNVLVFGGSQGARIFNETLPKVVNEFPEVQFRHQTGIKNYESTLKFYPNPLPSHVHVLPYLENMAQDLAWADVVICRSGASSVAELAAIGVHALFVPFPGASDDHQKKNAMVLVEKNGADIIENKNFNASTLTAFIKGCLNDPERSLALSRQIKGFHQLHSGAKMTEYLGRYIHEAHKV